MTNHFASLAKCSRKTTHRSQNMLLSCASTLRSFAKNVLLIRNLDVQVSFSHFSSISLYLQSLSIISIIIFFLLQDDASIHSTNRNSFENLRVFDVCQCRSIAFDRNSICRISLLHIAIRLRLRFIYCCR